MPKRRCFSLKNILVMAGVKRLLHSQAKCFATMGGLLEPCTRGHKNIILTLPLNKGSSFKRNLEKKVHGLVKCKNVI